MSHGLFSSYHGRLQYLQLATFWVKFQMPQNSLTSAHTVFVYNNAILLHDLVIYHQLPLPSEWVLCVIIPFTPGSQYQFSFLSGIHFLQSRLWEYEVKSYFKFIFCSLLITYFLAVYRYVLGRNYSLVTLDWKG